MSAETDDSLAALATRALGDLAIGAPALLIWQRTEAARALKRKDDLRDV